MSGHGFLDRRLQEFAEERRDAALAELAEERRHERRQKDIDDIIREAGAFQRGEIDCPFHGPGCEADPREGQDFDYVSPGSACPCDPSASDGLSCPDTSGNLLCDVPDCTIPADGDLCEAHGPAPRTPDAGPYSRSSATGSAWPWGHPGTLPTDKELLS